MKHLLVIVFLMILVYGTWHLCRRNSRNRFAQLVLRHGVRLGLLLAAVVALLVVAYNSNSIRLL